MTASAMLAMLFAFSHNKVLVVTVASVLNCISTCGWNSVSALSCCHCCVCSQFCVNMHCGDVCYVGSWIVCRRSHSPPPSARLPWEYWRRLAVLVPLWASLCLVGSSRCPSWCCSSLRPCVCLLVSGGLQWGASAVPFFTHSGDIRLFAGAAASVMLPKETSNAPLTESVEDVQSSPIDDNHSVLSDGGGGIDTGIVLSSPRRSPTLESKQHPVTMSIADVVLGVDGNTGVSSSSGGYSQAADNDRDELLLPVFRSPTPGDNSTSAV